MKIVPPMIVLLAFLSFNALPVCGQKLVCACEKGAGRECATKSSCPDGCTALCGSGNFCYSACRKEGLEKRFTLSLTKTSGKEIASELSKTTGYKIEFKAHPKYMTERYDLDVKNDDAFNALNFLSNRGSVKINDIPFADFKWNRVQEEGGKTVRPEFK